MSTVGGKAVPAGSYTIFTIPKADAWTLVISKKTGEWGTDYAGEKEDLVRVPDECLENGGAGGELHHRFRSGWQQMHAAHGVGKHPRPASKITK